MPVPTAVVERFLEHAGVPHRRVAEGTWVAQLAGERKLAIPLTIVLTGDRIAFESFFMRRPLENADRFYELLLRRNARAYGVSFAVDATGDVYLVGRRAAGGLDEEELDRIVGSILVEADGMFDAAIEVGFEHYLQADRAWRARAAGVGPAESSPGEPITSS